MSSYIAAQEDSYVFDCEKGEDLESALERFADSYDLDLSYPAYVINQIYPGKISHTGNNIDDILKDVLAPNDVEFQLLSDNKVLLRKVSFYEMELFDADEIIELSGVVKDAKSQEPLEYATVSIPSIQVGTYTDPDGSYQLLLSGKYIDEKVVISFIGYESTNLTVRDILLNQKLILQPASAEIDEVTIHGSEPLVIINSISAGTQMKLKKLLSLNTSSIQGNDILRKLQMLPGISNTDDRSSTIAIRGADDSETQVMIDGIPLYKTDHFYGIFGNVNGSYINDVTLYKNEMPINESGKSAGLVSMTSSRKVDDFSGQIDVNLLSTSATLQAPIDDHWSIKAAGRATYNNVANAGFFNLDSDFGAIDSDNFSRAAVLGVTPSFDFFDMNASLAYVSDKLVTNANFFKSYDALSSLYSNSFPSPPPPGRNRPVINQENFSNDHSWQNTGFSVNLEAKLQDNWKLSSTSFLTEMTDNGDLDYSFQNNNPSKDINKQINNVSRNAIRDIGSTLMLSKGDDHSLYSFGLKYVNHRNQMFLGEDNRRIFSVDDMSNEVNLFASTEQRLSDDFSVNIGARGIYYDLSSQIYFSPQVALSYQVDESFHLKASASRNYQFVRELSYSTRFGNEREVFVLSDAARLPPGSSNNFMVGGAYRSNEWTVDIEVYRIFRDNVLNFTTLLPSLINTEDNPNRQFGIFKGDGNTIGMDALLTYQKNGYIGMLSYTLSKSENQFNQIFRNQPFPTQDDRRHQLSLTNGYTFNNWTFTANVVYNSGRTYTDLSALQIGQDRKMSDPLAFLKRLPYYLRSDISVDYTYPFDSKQLVFGISVLNLFDRNNVKYRQFTAALPITDKNGNIKNRSAVLGTETNQLDRVVNVSLGLKF